MVIKSVRLTTDEDEYKKDLQLKREDIRLLQEWLKSQPQFPPIPDVLLIRHLQVCDYSIERTKQIVDTHFQLRTAIPELFTNTNPFLPEIQTVFRHTNMFMIPEHTKDGYRIIYAGLFTTDSSSYVLEEVMKVFAMVAEAIDGEQGSCPGYIICIDAEKVCFGHLTKINFSIVRRLFHFAYIVTDILPFYLENHKTVNVKEGGSVDENGNTIKLLEVHLLNVNVVIEKVYALIRPFVKKSLNDMVKFHSKMDDFYKIMPREIFPKDMGGEAAYTKEELSMQTKEKMEGLEEYYKMFETWKIAESHFGQYKILKKRDSISSTTSNVSTESFKALQRD
uniref:Alpha-tocopherol transfer protein-like n=1 Tax=Cacopsylla melanoneura TaxID=428564 RepID=A0A8D8VE39_9HEMI